MERKDKKLNKSLELIDEFLSKNQPEEYNYKIFDDKKTWEKDYAKIIANFAALIVKSPLGIILSPESFINSFAKLIATFYELGHKQGKKQAEIELLNKMMENSGKE